MGDHSTPKGQPRRRPGSAWCLGLFVYSMSQCLSLHVGGVGRLTLAIHLAPHHLNKCWGQETRAVPEQSVGLCCNQWRIQEGNPAITLHSVCLDFRAGKNLGFYRKCLGLYFFRLSLLKVFGYSHAVGLQAQWKQKYDQEVSPEDYSIHCQPIMMSVRII